ncbi:MAG: hypothetical protein ABW321_05740, partial [Polyangiales bacterium]
MTPLSPSVSSRLPSRSLGVRSVLSARMSGVPGSMLLMLGVGLTVVLGLSARQAWSGLDPRSLWLDDLWVAVLVKRASLAEVVQLHAPVPYGFVLIEKLVRGLFGDGHLQLQAAPFLARLFAVAGLAWLTTELTRHAGLGLLAGAGLAWQHELAQQSVRVKHYTLDAALSVGLLALAIRFLRQPSRARLVALGFLALVALPCSFPSAFVGPVVFSLCALWHAQQRRQLAPADAWHALRWLVVFDGLGLVWLGWVVRQKATPALQGFWSANYPATGSWRALWQFFRTGPGLTFLSGAFEPFGWLAWLVPIGVGVLLYRRWTRPLGVFVIVLYAAVLASGLLHL